jgi:hypothetical protein
VKFIVAMSYLLEMFHNKAALLQFLRKGACNMNTKFEMTKATTLLKSYALTPLW